MVKAIQIDVVNKTINEVESDSLQDIYKHLNCSTFDVARVQMPSDVDCFIDDESLLKTGYIDEDGTRHNLSGFKVGDTLLMGNGLLIGKSDMQGESTDCPITKEVVENTVTFIDFDREEDRPQPSIEFMSWE